MPLEVPGAANASRRGTSSVAVGRPAAAVRSGTVPSGVVPGSSRAPVLECHRSRRRRNTGRTAPEKNCYPSHELRAAAAGGGGAVAAASDVADGEPASSRCAAAVVDNVDRSPVEIFN